MFFAGVADAVSVAVSLGGVKKPKAVIQRIQHPVVVQIVADHDVSVCVFREDGWEGALRIGRAETQNDESTSGRQKAASIPAFGGYHGSAVPE